MGNMGIMYLQLEKTSYLVLVSVLHLDTVVVPRYLGGGVGHNGTVEHQSVPIVFLSDSWLLRECWSCSVNLRLGWGINS